MWFSLLLKFMPYILVGLLVTGFIGRVAFKAERAGEQRIIQKVEKQTKRTDDAWKRIDSNRLSLDDAVKRLRARASSNTR